MKPLTIFSRILLGVASLSMVATYFMPLWQIQLWAPQYPEGLNMKIWYNRLGGSFDIINGLNHYIGMREIKAEMFPEFHYIGILLGIFIALGLFAALMGTRRWLSIFIGTAFVYGVAALYDFYRWGYDYGHNLNPAAAIRVPGMTYQPPVIGYKNLLNFTAYSGPDNGGWLIIGVGIVAIALFAYEWFLQRKKTNIGNKQVKTVLVVMMLVTAFSGLSACSSGPEPIHYGHDACHFCKMTISDKRFGAEIVTKKGKVYKFDDLSCLVAFQKSNSVPADQVAQVVSIDFSKDGALLDVNQAFFLKNDALKSPMRGNVATFSNEADRDAVDKQLGGGTNLRWAELARVLND
jgi:copper chaperone NosL